MSEILAGVGVVVAALAGAAAILLPTGRARSIAMLVALVLFPALILGDQWHSRAIADLRDDSTRLVALGVLALGVSAALAFAFRRWPVLLPLAVVAALPFRVPLHAGGDTANLLVPLYLVIAGGVLSAAAGIWASGGGVPPAGGVGAGGPRTDAARPPAGPPVTASGPAGWSPSVWLPRILAAVVVLYAAQTLYSADFSKGLQDVCFFYVPFALVYALLREVEWDRRLLTLVLWVVGVEAAAFVLVGIVEYLSRELFWNDQVIRSNEFHTYFRVNSIFWDPNVYGRYLSLVIVVAMAALLWARERRAQTLLACLIALLWLGLASSFSQSSFAALLAGLAVLAALRWSVRWTLTAVVAAILAGMLVIVFAGGSDKVSPSKINIDTSGRANLVSGGIHLFAQRPLYGYGSGSFPKAYREHVKTRKVPVSVSHTEPITVAAEQGLIGLGLYVALLTTALWTMGGGLFRLRPAGPGTGSGGSAGGGGASVLDPPKPVPPTGGVAPRAAVLAAFVALLVHTMAYAGFYEDPISWVLLAVGVSFAAVPVREPA